MWKGRLCIAAVIVTLGAATAMAAQFEPDTDRAGSDYRSFDLSYPAPEACQQACQSERQCKAWTYVKPGVQGQQARCWLKQAVPAPRPSACCVSGVKQAAATAGQFESDTDRTGSDYRSFDLSYPSPEACQQACQSEQQCKAWTYVKPGVQGPQARCWLKQAVPAPRPSSCCVSGVKEAGGGLFKSRWDKVGGPGGPWTTGWVPNVTYQGCGHQASGCSCGGQNYCGTYRNGDSTYWWPQGCGGPQWVIRCTSVPQ